MRSNENARNKISNNTENHTEENVFQAVQQKFSILSVARDLGLSVKKVGGTYRADSIDNSGRGENALALYTNTNTWYDFMLETGGDITSLVALVRFNGDIKQALNYLMPDWDNGRISADIKARSQFRDYIEQRHNALINPSEKHQYQQRALDYLHSRRINDDTIRELKIGVGSTNGYNPSFRIFFPFWNEAGKDVLYFVSRRYDYSGNGENENQPKYLNASLSEYPFLRNAPLGLNTLKRKKDDTLIITEGIFDWLAFYQEGYSVLASHGGDFGKLWKEVLEKIKGFKRVILAYDNDEAGQNFTYKAGKILMQHRIPFSCANLLTKDVAEHYALTGNLDAILASTRQGFNWFIKHIIPKKPYEELTVGEKENALAKCRDFIKEIAIYSDSYDVHNIIIKLRDYFPKDLVSGLFEIARKGPAQAEIAEKVRLAHNIMYNPRTGFFEFVEHDAHTNGGGIWKQVDDETIMGYISKRLGKFATGGKLSSILKLIQADENVHSDIPIKKFNTLPLVSFLNGTLHIDPNTGEAVLKPHSPYDYVTVQLPFYYNPNADCKNWLKFIDDITSGRKDDQAVLQEFAGYPLVPHCKFQKALMLKGGGSNGKSVFFNIISAIFGGVGEDGRGYISSTDPSKWAKDFRLMPLRHSWLNISYDMESDMRGSEGIFKKVVAGEVLEDSYKHKDPIAFSTRSKLMMACNYFPTVNDSSDGFMRRWLIVELSSHFVDKDKVRPFTNDKPLDPFLEDKLMKELPGIFNWMLAGLQRLLRQGNFTHTANQDRLIEEFRTANNPLYSFVDEKQETFKGSEAGHIVPRHSIFLMFDEWAEKNKILPMPSNRFYSNMRSIFNSLSIPFDEDGSDWIFYFKE